MVKRSLLVSAFCAALIPLPTLAVTDGAENYKLRCSHCHGGNGQGTRAQIPPLGPALKGNPFVVNGSPAALRQVIRKGRQGEKRLYNDAYPNMPAFGAEAIDDVDALVAYLKGDMQK